MLSPEFPYKGNQIILSSDRVLLHAKSDGIFLFGKRMVALSPKETINLDATEKIILDSDLIELGHNARTLGQPVILGNIFISQMKDLLQAIQQAGNLLSSVAESNPGASYMNMSTAGNNLRDAAKKMKGFLESPSGPQYPLSKNTYTR